MSHYMPYIDVMVSLKIDNIPYKATIEDLKVVFERYGDIGDIYIPRNRITKKNRGFAFVRFFNRRDAVYAKNSMDGYIMNGKELRVLMANYGKYYIKRDSRHLLDGHLMNSCTTDGQIMDYRKMQDYIFYYNMYHLVNNPLYTTIHRSHYNYLPYSRLYNSRRRSTTAKRSRPYYYEGHY